MTTHSLDALARGLIADAATRPERRSIGALAKAGRLTQLGLGFTAGGILPDHENPGDATLLVLRGEVRLSWGDEHWDGGPGDLCVIPQERHELLARTDAFCLLSFVRREREPRA